MTASVSWLGRKQMGAAAASLVLFAAACGGGGPSSAESSAAEAAAAQNETQLVLSQDLAASELLDTADGSIASLAETITGDRPVLVWYWAPL